MVRSTALPRQPLPGHRPQRSAATPRQRTSAAAAPRWACACGGHCPRCASAAAGTIASPTPAPAPATSSATLETQADEAAAALPPAALQALAGLPPLPRPEGLALPDAVSRPLAQAWGTPLRGTRLHSAPAASGQALGARAWAQGRDVGFAPGHYQPGTPQGRALIAHELAHVAQQQRLGPRLQRSPLVHAGPFGGGTQQLHERLARRKEREQGMPSPGAVQYTAGWQAWLQNQRPDKVAFLPELVHSHEPLPQAVGQPLAANGRTELDVNGQRPAGADAGALVQDWARLLTPAAVVQEPGLVLGRSQCSFDPAAFSLVLQPVVDELTPPPAGGWTGLAAPATVGSPPACAGKAAVKVTLTDASGSPAALHRLVHASELEHVAALRGLHQRYLVPYYHATLQLQADAGDSPSCEASLRARHLPLAQQAAWDFVLGDMAETQRFDMPGGTHHATLVPAVVGACESVTLSSRQNNPPAPGAGPGNVRPVAPVVQPVDAATLEVRNLSLFSGGTLLRVFASRDEALQALGALTALGVSAIHRIGPVDLWMAGAGLAMGTVAGPALVRLDPQRLQVIPGPGAGGTWALGHAQGNAVLMLVDFGAQRDQAYAAAALLVQLGARHQMALGSGAAPAMVAYTA